MAGILTNGVRDALFEPDEFDFAICCLPVWEQRQDKPQCGCLRVSAIV